MSAHPSPEQLGAYLDGELDASARTAVDAHLRECAECGAHLADLSAVDDAAREMPLVVPEGYFDDFAPRVRARLAKRTPARWRPPAWGWAAAAALLLAVITPLALQERRSGSPLPAERAKLEPAPAAPTDGTFERDTRAGYKQNEGLAPMAAPPAVAPPATVGVPRAPAPIAAAEAEGRLGRRSLEGRLDRRDRSAARDEDRQTAVAGGVAAPELPSEAQAKREEAAPSQGSLLDSTKLAEAEEKKADEVAEQLRAAGYSQPPPASAQRQHGPRAQNTTPSRGAELRKAAPPPESKDKAQAYADAEKAATADAPPVVLQESVEVTPRARAAGAGLASAKFRSLADSAPPRSDADARLLRESWRTFAAENPHHPQADEARVRLVEAGALAYRLSRRPQDREIALRDARVYLERPQAPQAARVRAAIKTLEPAVP